MLHAYTFRSILIDFDLSSMFFVGTCDVVRSSEYDASLGKSYVSLTDGCEVLPVQQPLNRPTTDDTARITITSTSPDAKGPVQSIQQALSRDLIWIDL